MSKFAVMPLDDYVSACDTIREKTENTEVIKSGDMAEEIASVYEAGQKSGADTFGTLATVTGSNKVIADYVHPTEHTVGVKLSSKNLFDYNDYSTLIRYDGADITSNYLTKENGMFYIAYSYYNSSAWLTPTEQWKLPAGTYTLSGKCKDVLGSNIFCGMRWSDGIRNASLTAFYSSDEEWNYFKYTFTITEEKNVAGVYLQDNSSGVRTTICFADIQLELGSTATEYTPYIDNLSNIEVNLQSDNLWTHGDVTFTGYGTYDLGAGLKAGKTYTLSAFITSSDTDSSSCYIYDLTNAKTIAIFDKDKVSSITFTPTDDIPNIRFYSSYPTANSVGDIATYSDVSLVEDNTYTSNADGVVEGVMSISPTMNFSCDNDSVVITVEYYQDTYEIGVKSEYDRFWDRYQNFGNNVSYFYAFALNRFREADNYNPKYPINCGTQTTSAQQIFASASYIYDTKVPIIVNGHSAVAMFANAINLVTIREIQLVNDDVSFASAFTACNKLENITITGTIGQDISFPVSPLTVDSIKSIISCLKDYSGTDTTHTVTFKADRETMLTDEEKAVATDKGWTLVWS